MKNFEVHLTISEKFRINQVRRDKEDVLFNEIELIIEDRLNRKMEKFITTFNQV